MKKYLIKETSTGTEKNPNFSGVSSTRYLASGHAYNLFRCVFEDDYTYSEEAKYIMQQRLELLAAMHGYSSLGTCKRAITIHERNCQAETDRYHFHTFKLEPFEVEV